MHQDIENIIKKWLKKHKDDGQWVSDYDGEFDLENCCLDGDFDLNDLADEVLKVVRQIIEDKIKFQKKVVPSSYEAGYTHALEDLLSNLSTNKENENNE